METYLFNVFFFFREDWQVSSCLLLKLGKCKQLAFLRDSSTKGIRTTQIH